GRTPLHYAAIRGATVSILYLLARGASLQREDSDSNTPLGLALLSNNPSCAITLLQKGADVQHPVHQPLGYKKKIFIPANDPKDPSAKREIEKQCWKLSQHSTFYYAVKNNWHGAAYTMLDNKF